MLDLRKEVSEGSMGDRSKSVPGLNVPVSRSPLPHNTLRHNGSLYYKILLSIDEKCSCVVFYMSSNVLVDIAG